jgi:ribosome-binding ATPase YchF (GTP1/OBG family)
MLNDLGVQESGLEKIIYNDFEKGFRKAELISYEDFVSLGLIYKLQLQLL